MFHVASNFGKFPYRRLKVESKKFFSVLLSEGVNLTTLLSLLGILYVRKTCAGNTINSAGNGLLDAGNVS